MLDVKCCRMLYIGMGREGISMIFLKLAFMLWGMVVKMVKSEELRTKAVQD